MDNNGLRSAKKMESAYQSTLDEQLLSQSNYERQLFVNTSNIEVRTPTSVEHSHAYKYFCDGQYDIMVGFEQENIRIYQQSLEKLLQEYKLEVNEIQIHLMIDIE